MQSHKCILSAFTLSTAMFFGAAAMAADLPKEGTFNGTIPTAGTIKAYPVAKEQVELQWPSDGLTVDTGLLDHMTWHDTANGSTQWRGNV